MSNAKERATTEVRIEALEAGLGDMARRVMRIERWYPGPTGSGKCICKLPPDRDRYRDGFLVDELNNMLDHRCPRHGEKAQPRVWGRHKDHELIVTPAQWESLGVTYEEVKP